MTSLALTAVVLVGAGTALLCALGRLFLLFRAARRLFDGGHRTIVPILDRVTASVGAPAVSMLVDLGASDRPATLLGGCLAQRYRNFDVVAVAGSAQIPIDVKLAFDLQQIAVSESATVFRSGRDERLLVLVPLDDEADPLAIAAQNASGELLCPVHESWQLHSGAVAELAGSWIRQPDLLGSFGVLHPSAAHRGGSARLVSLRADLLAAAGLGDGAAALGALGAMASGQVGAIVGLIERSVYLRIGGVHGGIDQPRTWAHLAAVLMEDCYQRGLPIRVRLHPRPLGHVDGRGRANARDLIRLPTVRGATPALWRVLWATRFMPWLTALWVGAGILGALTDQVTPEVLLVAGSTPLVLATVVLVGLMMDDRALRPVRSTRRRLGLVLGAVGASVGGVAGSPLRGAAGQLH